MHWIMKLRVGLIVGKHDANGWQIRTLMRRRRSVKAAFMEKVSFLPGVLPGGSFARILYLRQDSECRMRTRSSSGRLARSRISANVSLSSA